METNKLFNADGQHLRGNGRRWFWIAAFIGGLLLVWNVAEGHSQTRRVRGPNGDDQAEWTADEIARAVAYLHVDDASSKHITNVLTVLGDELESARADRRQLTMALDTLLRADVLDKNELEALRVEAQDLARRAVDDSFDAVTEIAAALRADQRRELLQLWRARR